MKKIITGLIVSTLFLHSLSISVAALDMDFSDRNEQVETGIQEQPDRVEENKQTEVEDDVLSQTENEPSTNEDLIEEVLVGEENIQETNDVIADEVTTHQVGERLLNGENSEVIDGITYEWLWEESSFTLDINANNGTSETVMSIMEAHNLLTVKHLSLRNLPVISSSFQLLNNLNSLTFANNTTIHQSSAFRGLPDLENIYGEVDVRVSTDRVFSDNPKLTYFQPRFGSQGSNDGTYTFANTQLDEIKLAANSNITINSSSLVEGQIFGNMPNLRRVIGSLGNGSNSNKQLKDQFGGSFNLEELRVSNHTGLNIERRRYRDDFFEGFTNLQKFNLSGFSSQTSAIFNLEAFKYTPNLKELRYDSFKGETEEIEPWTGSIVDFIPNLEVFQSNSMIEIPGNFFNNHENIREVIVPASTIFGNNAFQNTPSLKSVSAPSLKTMGNKVFVQTGLEEIYFPALEETGNYPFDSNEHLKKADLPNLRISGWQLFAYCSSLEEVNLPKLEKINHADFLRTYNLETLYLPSATEFDGLQNLRNSGVKRLILPKMDLTSGDATSLEYVNIEYLEVGLATDPNQFKSILSSINSLKELRIIDQQEFDSSFSDINESIDTIEKITLDSVIILGDNIFRSMTSLKNIEAPKLKEVGKSTFQYSGLTKIYFPLLEVVGAHGFGQIPVIEMTLPKLRSLGNSALAECTLLETVDFPLLDYVGLDALKNTISLKSVVFPNMISLTGGRVFFNSGIETLDLPKVEHLGVSVLQFTNKLKTVSLPNVKTIGDPASQFHMSAVPYGMEFEGSTIFGKSTTWRNSSSTEVIFTTLENANVIKPLLENQNDNLLGIALDGNEKILGETEFNLVPFDVLHVPVESTIIINDNLDVNNVKATVEQIWFHDGASVKNGQDLEIDSILPWHGGIYERELKVNFSKTGEELFHYKIDTQVLLSVTYTNELEVSLELQDEKIAIGDTTQVAVEIANVTGFGAVDVTIDLVAGLLNGLEIVEDSLDITLVDNKTGIETKESKRGTNVFDYTIPADHIVRIQFDVFGLNNESVESNVQAIVREKNETNEDTHTWGAADRLIVENGRIRFMTVPDVIDFKGWNSGDDMFLGDVSVQEKLVDFQIEDLRGSERSAENEIDATRNPWRIEVSTDDVFLFNENQRSTGNLRVVAQENNQNWELLNGGFPLFQKNTWQETPIEHRFTDISIGENQKLGIMIDQLSGFPENEILDVELTFELLNAP